MLTINLLGAANHSIYTYVRLLRAMCIRGE